MFREGGAYRPPLRPRRRRACIGRVDTATPFQWTRPRQWWSPIRRESESAFEVAIRISPVAIIYGTRRFNVAEHNSSVRLLKELHRLGKARIPLRGMISAHGSLARESIRALNCYLEHYFGRHPRPPALHRHVWIDLQREVGFRWNR